jgi:hypothetical protein
MADRLEALCCLLLFAAVSTNTVEAFTNPTGPWWDGLRLALSTAFALSLLAVIASRLRARRG